MKQDLSRISRIAVGAVGLTLTGLVLGGGVASAQDIVPGPGIDDITNTGTFVPDLTIPTQPTAPTDGLGVTTPQPTDGISGQLLPGGGVNGTFTSVDEFNGSQSSVGVNLTPNGIGGFTFGSEDPNGNTFEGTVAPGLGQVEFGFPF